MCDVQQQKKLLELENKVQVRPLSKANRPHPKTASLDKAHPPY